MNYCQHIAVEVTLSFMEWMELFKKNRYFFTIDGDHVFGPKANRKIKALPLHKLN